MEQLFLPPIVDVIEMDIHTASSIGNEERVRDILESANNKFEKINEKNKDDWTSLMYAAQSGNQRVVMCLLEEGASSTCANTFGINALMLAAMYGHIESAFILLDNGADINASDSENWTPLFYAVSDGHQGVVHLLLEHKCKVNIADETYGMTPLMYAAAAGHEMIILELLKHNADAFVQSKNQETAQEIAIRKGNLKAAKAIESHILSKKCLSPMNKLSLGNKSLKDILGSLNLLKYYPVFEQHEVDLHVFWTLTDDDLKDIGIKAIGPRRKITTEISKNNHKKSVNDKMEKDELERQINVLKQGLINAEMHQKAMNLQLQHCLQILENHLKSIDLLHESYFTRSALIERLKQLKQFLTRDFSKCSRANNCCDNKISAMLNVLDIMEQFIIDYHKDIASLKVEAEILQHRQLSF